MDKHWTTISCLLVLVVLTQALNNKQTSLLAIDIGKQQSVSDVVTTSTWKYFKFTVPADQVLKVTVNEDNFKYCQISSYLQADSFPSEQSDNHLFSSFSQQYQEIIVKPYGSERVYYLGIKGEYCYQPDPTVSANAFSLNVDWTPEKGVFTTQALALVVSLSTSGFFIVSFVMVALLAVVGVVFYKLRKPVNVTTADSDEEFSKAQVEIQIKQRAAEPFTPDDPYVVVHSVQTPETPNGY